MSAAPPGYRHLLVDAPRPYLRRLTLDRPEKRNALHNALRGELFDALERADRDETVRVIVIRGAGPCFSAGYDLASNVAKDQPWHTAGGDGNWARHVVEGWFRIWDLAVPVIAQVHGCVSPVEASSRPPATSSTPPRTRRSVIRRCA